MRIQIKKKVKNSARIPNAKASQYPVTNPSWFTIIPPMGIEQIEAAAYPDAFVPNPALLSFSLVYKITKDALFSSHPPKPKPATKRAMVSMIIFLEMIVRKVPSI